MRLKDNFLNPEWDYIKRLSYIHGGSRKAASVAVLCGGETPPYAFTEKLYQNQIDFDYLPISAVEDGTAKIGADGSIVLGDKIYTAVIAEDELNIPEEIKDFNAYGGKLFRSDYDIERLPRDIRAESYQPSLRFSHIMKEGTDILIFENESAEPIETKICIGECGACEIWNPRDGSIASAETDEHGNIDLRLEGNELLLYVLSDILY